jgi:signal transduction histidine kinase
MSDSSSQPRASTVARRFFTTVWPAVSAADSESQRRKKFALRCGQLTVVAMVVFAVAGRMAAQSSWPQAAGLVAAGLVYVVWYLYGLRGAVRWVLWQRGAGPPPVWPPPAGRKEVVYFAVQLGLAGLICWLGGRKGSPLLVWLVLLPPVAQSAFMLRRGGVAVVSGISMGLLVGVGCWQHGWRGWDPLPESLLEFSYAVLFTLVLTTLAVSSERARGEVERLAGELSAANEKLRAYAVQAEELAATRERNRLAREVHDSLGHYLTVVNVQIEAARALRERDPARTWDALDQAQALTQQGLQDIRRSVAALRASPLDDQPLAQVLHEVVNRSCATGLAAELQVWGEARALSPQARLALYRAGQEGLTNVRKHARVAEARLALDFRAPAKVSLSVTDKGAGADLATATAGGFGLLGLRERVQLLGGAVRVQTAPGAGFFLEVEVPG